MAFHHESFRLMVPDLGGEETLECKTINDFSISITVALPVDLA